MAQLYDSEYDWKFNTVPQQHVSDVVCAWSRCALFVSHRTYTNCAEFTLVQRERTWRQLNHQCADVESSGARRDGWCESLLLVLDVGLIWNQHWSG